MLATRARSVSKIWLSIGSLSLLELIRNNNYAIKDSKEREIEKEKQRGEKTVERTTYGRGISIAVFRESSGISDLFHCNG